MFETKIFETDTDTLKNIGIVSLLTQLSQYLFAQRAKNSAFLTIGWPWPFLCNVKGILTKKDFLPNRFFFIKIPKLLRMKLRHIFQDETDLFTNIFETETCFDQILLDLYQYPQKMEKSRYQEVSIRDVTLWFN